MYPRNRKDDTARRFSLSEDARASRELAEAYRQFENATRTSNDRPSLLIRALNRAEGPLLEVDFKLQCLVNKVGQEYARAIGTAAMLVTMFGLGAVANETGSGLKVGVGVGAFAVEALAYQRYLNEPNH